MPRRRSALANSVRLMQEGGARMVKLESGAEQLRIVEFLAGHDIAVCAHLGLKPQSVHKTGGFRVQGRETDAASAHPAGCQGSANPPAPISCCSNASRMRWARRDRGAACAGDRHRCRSRYADGQIQVLYDILDITSGRKPRFVRNFMQGAGSPLAALQAYVTAVKNARVSRPGALLLLIPDVAPS